jgi:hypothetical protein
MNENRWQCLGCETPVNLFNDYCVDCYHASIKDGKQREESSAVNHPNHYNQIKGVECIDVAEQMTFNLGNALKYIWRCGDKGKKIEDLEKAIWYIKREIGRTQENERMEKKKHS